MASEAISNLKLLLALHNKDGDDDHHDDVVDIGPEKADILDEISEVLQDPSTPTVPSQEELKRLVEQLWIFFEQ